MAHNKKILLDALKNLNNTKSVVKNSNLKEIPEMKKGGKFSSDIGATNRLFKKNSLFKKNPLFKSKKKKSKGKTYDPLAPRSAAPMYFDNGGIVELDGYRFKKDASGNWTYESGAPVTDRGMIQRLTYEAKPVGSPVVQSAPKVTLKPIPTRSENIKRINDLSMSPRIADQEQAAQLSELQREQDIFNPEEPDMIMKPKNMNDLKGYEFQVNRALGFPMDKAHFAAEAAAGDFNEEVDNFRHPLAGRYTTEAIRDYVADVPYESIPLVGGYVNNLMDQYIAPSLGFAGSNVLGAGHEFMTLVNPRKDDRSLLTRLSEAGEDLYNNYVGSKVGASNMTPEEKTNYLLYLSYNNKLPDGVVIEKDPKAKGPNNLYFKKGPNDPGKYKSSYEDGGEYIELELTPEEIDEYKKGGYIVEDISVPSLNQMKKGGEPKKKKRKTDDHGRYRSEDGNVRTPLTPEMQAVMPPDEWGQYIQEFPEVYTTRTKEQQDIRNALDYQQRMAELYPGRPTQSDAIQSADWLWQLGMLGAAGGLGKSAVQAAEAAGSRALPYITGALETSIPGMASVPGATVGNAIGAMAAVDSGRRLLDVPSQVQKGEYADAAANVLTGALDIGTAGMISPLYKGAKATATELKAALEAKNPANFEIPKQWYKKSLYDLYDKGTDSYKLVEIDVPQEVIPARSYDDVKHKLKNLRSDLNISPTEHYLSRIFGRIPIGMSRDRTIADPRDGKLFDSNTRYWLNRLYGNTPSGEEVISKHLLAKDYGKLYKEGLSFEEAQGIMKQYNDPIGYKEVSKELPGSPNSTLGIKKAGFIDFKGMFQKYPKGPFTPEEIKKFKETPYFKKTTEEHNKLVKEFGDSWTLPNHAQQALETGNRHAVNPQLYGGNNYGIADYIMTTMVPGAAIGTAGLAGLIFSPPAVRSRAMRSLGITGVPGGLSDSDTTINLTNEPMDYAKVNQFKDGRIIIGGEFIEQANNTVRKAKDWEKATDTYSDKLYPSKSIQSFYGVEDGKFKVGKASDFKPNTEIVPRRFGEIDIKKAVLNGEEMRLLDKKNKPIYQNTPNTGKFILYSPSTGKSQFNYINTGKSGVNKVNRFLKQNKDAQYIHLDNGRYEFYGVNEPGLTNQDFRNYYEQDLNRKGNPGYNLIIKKDGGESQIENDYIELELTPEEIQEYVKGGFIVEDISVPSLNRMDNGGEPKGRKKERFVEGTYDPNDTAGYMLTEDEVVVPGEASAWGKARQAYKERLSEEDYVQRKKREFLLLHPSLNRTAGVTMDRFPANVEENFRKDYRYKTNTAVVRKVSKQEGWNPNKRKEYVDDLNETQRDIVAESKYGSKLQPNFWDRGLAGVATLVSPFSSGIQRMMNEGYMPGLTKKESKEILNSKVFGIPMGGAEIFTPLQMQGQALANYAKSRGLSTGSDYKELPALGSGESMANVSDKDVMGLDLPGLIELGFAPEAGVNLLKGAYNLGKTGVQTLKINPFSFNPTAIEGIDLAKGRAYKTLLPEAVQEQKAIASVAQAPKEPWKMQPMSGLHLKSTMTDGAISKIVEPKTGLINLDQALGIIAKESGGADKVAIIKQGLGENLPKKMDFNEFRKVVQDQLIPLDKTILPGGEYGVERIGYELGSSEIKTEKIILSNKNKFGRGSDAHSNPEETLGHVHILYDAEEPGAAIVTQVQADPFQGPFRSAIKTKENAEFNLKAAQDRYENMKDFHNKIIKVSDDTYQMPDGQKISKNVYDTMLIDQKENVDLAKALVESFDQRQLLAKNHPERYLQEIIEYAAKRGDINRIKLPTPETANSIQNYTAIETFSPEMTALRQKIVDASESGDRAASIQAYTDYEIALENARLNAQKAEENIVKYKKNKLKELEQELGSNDPAVEKLKSEITILEKYQEYPKIIKKLYGVEPKIVTDSKGNTWYEFNIPYEFKEGPAEIKAFRYGGTNNKLAKFIR